MKYILLLYILSFYLHAADFKALLFNGNCTTCHFINKEVSAPSIKYIKTIYQQAFPIKQDFINYMTNWVQHPNKNGSLMHNAIDKYELMPELAFDKETLYEITSYIYEMNNE